MKDQEFRQARKELGWSQRDAARELGTTQTTVSAWETGKHPVCSRAAVAIGAARQLKHATETSGEVALALDRTRRANDQERTRFSAELESLRLDCALAQRQRDKAQYDRDTFRLNCLAAQRERDLAKNECEAMRRTLLLAGEGAPNWALDAFGLSRGAPWEEIRNAYREAVKEAHPDRGGSGAGFRACQAAYEVLKEFFNT